MPVTLPSILRKTAAALSTFFLVTTVAFLVWLYAVQKNVRDQTPLTLSLRLGSDDQRRDFVITPEEPVNVNISFRASSSLYDKFVQNLRNSGNSNIPIPLAFDGTAKNGIFSMQVNLKNILQESVLKNVGPSDLKIINMSESPLPVTAEKLVTVYLPVEEHHDSVRIPQPPTIDASSLSIKVRLPEHLAAKIRGVHAVADVNKLEWANAKPGDLVTRPVPVEIPALATDMANPVLAAKNHITLEPAEVKVTLLAPEKTTAEFKLDRTINIAAPQALLEKWNFVIPDKNAAGIPQSKFLNDLRLTGLRDAMDLVIANEKKKDDKTPKLVWAVIRIGINDDDMPSDGYLLNMPVEVVTPPGISPPENLPKLTVYATKRKSN